MTKREIPTPRHQSWRVYREHHGLSMSQLAAKAGVPQSYISDIENGKKPGSIEAWKSLAKALGLKVDDLVD